MLNYTVSNTNLPSVLTLPYHCYPLVIVFTYKIQPCCLAKANRKNGCQNKKKRKTTQKRETENNKN